LLLCHASYFEISNNSTRKTQHHLALKGIPIASELVLNFTNIDAQYRGADEN